MDGEKYGQPPPSYPDASPQQVGVSFPQQPPPQHLPHQMGHPHAQPMHQTVVVTQQPQVLPPQRAPQNIREWDTGLCGCFEDCGICCLAYWCGWCMVCQMQSQEDEHCCLAFCAPTLAIAMLRTKVRSMYGIRGGTCGDACVSTYCFLCALSQLKRQMKIYKEQEGGAMVRTEVRIERH